ncbi:hypothetical protein [Halomarina ordinaria]|uniref:DUF7993 domain-containing protein n=1 Tax=Halomarina ordinaria TaxID=3033939 RepID=A0ABD5U8G7_9EURY|nr:hypothetical protein [Halomarina sp. PSRA2]
MTDDTVTAGRRIAELLASELVAREDGPLAALDLAEVQDVDGDTFGEFAYGVERDGERVADVYVHDDRVRVEFRVGVDAVPPAADERGLRVRPKATRPPRTIVFLEDGAAVKRVLPVVTAALDAA